MARLRRAIALIAAILSTCAITLHLQARVAWSSSQKQYAALSKPQRPPVKDTLAHDFVQRLGSQPTAQALAAQLAELTSTSVGLSGFTATRRDATASTLGRTELQLQLHGPYAAVKQALAQLLDRSPNAVLAHLTLHRGASGVDAQITVWLLSPAKPAGG